MKTCEFCGLLVELHGMSIVSVGGIQHRSFIMCTLCQKKSVKTFNPDTAPRATFFINGIHLNTYKQVVAYVKENPVFSCYFNDDLKVYKTLKSLRQRYCESLPSIHLQYTPTKEWFDKQIRNTKYHIKKLERQCDCYRMIQTTL